MPENRKERQLLLSLFSAPLMSEILDLWDGFREVVQLIQNNQVWLHRILNICELISNENE